MTIEPSDPPRIVDEDSPEALRELVRAKRRRGPSDATMRRLSERFESAGLLARPPTEVAAAPRVETKLTYYKHGIVALAVATGLVFSWRATQAPPVQATTSASPPSADVTEPASQTTDLPPAHSVADDRLEPATVSVEDLPHVAPRAPATSASAVVRSAVPTSAKLAARTEASHETPERAASHESPSELEIIQSAQTALRSDPERALAATREHERLYPSGELLQEREVLAVEALSRLGRKEEALRRARSLVQRFARTPYASRLETAIGQPLTPESGRARSIDRDEPASSPVTTH